MNTTMEKIRLNDATKKRLSTTASKTLTEYGLLSFPVDIVKLAHECFGFLILETLLPQNITGMLAFDEKCPVLGTASHKLIVISSNLSPERQRFVVAHELAHFINRESNEPLYFRDYDNSQNEKEIEADYLARCLLMPEELCPKKGTAVPESMISHFVKRFWISRQRAEERIKELGMYQFENRKIAELP